MYGATLNGLRLFVFALVVAAQSSAVAQDAGMGAASLGGSASFRPRIVNGVYTSQFPTTGALLDSSNVNNASLICSGVLVGCQTFLTAGHCVEGFLNPANYSVFLQHAGFFGVSRVDLHPDYGFPVGDVAVITLSTPVNGIAPTPLNTTMTPSFNTPGTIVGFGRSGGGSTNFDYGLKRAGDVVTASCTVGVSNMTSVCWDFSDPLGPPGTDSNTCNGDSGGPLFVDFGDGSRVAGVTSGGDSATCLPTDHSYDANVFFYRSWVQGIAGADLNNTSCGSLPQVGATGTDVVGIVGSLSSIAQQGTHMVQVPSGSSALRIALNAVDDGSDFDLYVRFGNPPTTSTFDCKADGSNQYGFCQFADPTPGTWYVLVNRFAGSGTYQVTTTTFGPDCSNLANNGLPCDDSNSCTSTDVCQAGICAGTPVANGNTCDDGNPCTQPDTCQAGLCTGGEEPKPSCSGPFVPGRGALRLLEPPGKPQKVQWSWTNGSNTMLADFGDPLTSTSYDLCMYDQSGGVDELVYGKHVPAGGLCGTRACWAATSKGYKYRDTRALNGPISTMILSAGPNGKARITLKGKGDLSLPPLPLAQQSTVTVQLRNATHCWEAHFSSNSRNTTTDFKAKGD